MDLDVIQVTALLEYLNLIISHSRSIDYIYPYP